MTKYPLNWIQREELNDSIPIVVRRHRPIFHKTHNVSNEDML